VARRWLRVAFLLPGAAALAAFVVELAVSGNLVANAGAIVINTYSWLGRKDSNLQPSDPERSALSPARKLNSTTASDLWIARQRRV
jgi:hypothetical protein